MIRGAIFDLDGVLLDSMGIWEDLGARYLQRLHITPEPGLNEVLFPMSMEQGAVYLKAHYPLQQSEAEICGGIARMLKDYYAQEVPAKPGAAALLAFLAERGISMAAATSSPRAHVTAALERLAEALGTAPAETLVFEDSLYALKTAKTAGFRTVGVLDAHGETDQAGLKEAAEVYLTSLTEFPGHWVHLNK